MAKTTIRITKGKGGRLVETEPAAEEETQVAKKPVKGPKGTKGTKGPKGSC